MSGKGLLFCKLCLPALAIFILVGQVSSQLLFDLSQWKGGGMGMFSSSDRPNNRFSIVTIEHEGQRYRLTDYGDRRDVLDLSMRILPTDANYQTFADSILNTRWYFSNDLSEPLAFNSDGEIIETLPAIRKIKPRDTHARIQSTVESFRPQRVSIEIFKLAYDRQSGALSAQPMSSRAFDRPASED